MVLAGFLMMGTGCATTCVFEQPFPQEVDGPGLSTLDEPKVHTVGYRPPAENRPYGEFDGGDNRSFNIRPGTDDFLEEQPDPYPVVRLPPIEEVGMEESFYEPIAPGGFFAAIGSDYYNYYSIEPMTHFLLATGITASLANTDADESLQDLFQRNQSNGFFKLVSEAKVFGDGTWQVPLVYAGIAITGSFFEEGTLGSGIGQWSQRSLRTIVVGWPPMISMQYLTGASRPGEAPSGSYWRPFEDTNGVSGHSFMGAIPFLNAAHMIDNPFWKAMFFAGSTLTAFSRVIDDRHYFSQAYLGWTMAFIAAGAVDQTNTGRQSWRVFPWMHRGGAGVGFEMFR